MTFVLDAHIKEKLRLSKMKKHQKAYYEDYTKDVKPYAPKGYLQPLYDLVGQKIKIESTTHLGQRGTTAQLSSVSQDFDRQLGFGILILRFESGSNVNIPLPSTVEALTPKKVLLDFKRKSPLDDVANPYRKMRS
jgi:hypothetical protein